MRLHIKTSTDGKQWHWSLKGQNGQIVASGENYKRCTTMVNILNKFIIRGDATLIASLEVEMKKYGRDIMGKLVRL